MAVLLAVVCQRAATQGLLSGNTQQSKQVYWLAEGQLEQGLLDGKS